MRTCRKWITLLTLTAFICGSYQTATAREYATDAGGCAYEEAIQSTSIAPAIALALVAIAGIIAVGVQNRSSSHGHTHSHTDSD